MKRIVRLTWVLLITASIQINAQDVGDTAPNFQVGLLGGETFNLADHEGKVVMVFFFGNTCPSCRAVGSIIESSIYQEYMDEEGNLVAVGIDTWNSSSNETSVTGFKNTTGITFPLAIKGGDVAVNYKTTYDRLMVIDRAGILVHKGLVVASNDINNTIAAIEESLLVTGVEEKISESPIVYPNPAKDILYFSAGTELISGVTLFDASGRTVMVSSPFSGQAKSEYQVDLYDFEPGFYFYTIETEAEPIKGRVVIQK
jgi:peroxiredoxin